MKVEGAGLGTDELTPGDGLMQPNGAGEVCRVGGKEHRCGKSAKFGFGDAKSTWRDLRPLWVGHGPEVMAMSVFIGVLRVGEDTQEESQGGRELQAKCHHQRASWAGEEMPRKVAEERRPREQEGRQESRLQRPGQRWL